MEHIATMESCESAMPDNIGTAVALEIKQPCGVVDAYRILDDYPNIKHVKVAGQNYTSTEIKQMGIGERLGSGERARPIFIENIAEDRDPVPAPAPAPPTVMQWRTIPPSPYLTEEASAMPWAGVTEQLNTAPATTEPFNMDSWVRQMYAVQRERNRSQASIHDHIMQQPNAHPLTTYETTATERYQQQRTARPRTVTEWANQNIIRGTTADVVWYDEVSTGDFYHDPAQAV